jgi:hypothetical protein
MTINNSKTTLQKIGKGTLKTLELLTFPGLYAAKKYIMSDFNQETKRQVERHPDQYWRPAFEYPIFLVATAISAGVVLGINEGYNSLAKTKYSTKNIKIEIKPNTAITDSTYNYASYVSPLIRLVTVGLANDVTSIKKYGLEIEVENSKIITFDKTQGFTLNKEACYTNDFRVKEENKWVEYHPTKIKHINSDYEKTKKKSERIRNKAIDTGNIGEISELEDKMRELQGNYEYQRLQLKQTQTKLEQEVTDIVNQLNTEYLNYKNTQNKK